jgi:hypothetical protein
MENARFPLKIDHAKYIVLADLKMVMAQVGAAQRDWNLRVSERNNNCINKGDAS